MDAHGTVAFRAVALSWIGLPAGSGRTPRKKRGGRSSGGPAPGEQVRGVSLDSLRNNPHQESNSTRCCQSTLRTRLADNARLFPIRHFKPGRRALTAGLVPVVWNRLLAGFLLRVSTARAV